MPFTSSLGTPTSCSMVKDGRSNLRGLAAPVRNHPGGAWPCLHHGMRIRLDNAGKLPMRMRDAGKGPLLGTNRHQLGIPFTWRTTSTIMRHHPPEKFDLAMMRRACWQRKPLPPTRSKGYTRAFRRTARRGARRRGLGCAARRGARAGQWRCDVLASQALCSHMRGREGSKRCCAKLWIHQQRGAGVEQASMLARGGRRRHGPARPAQASIGGRGRPSYQNERSGNRSDGGGWQYE